MKSKKETATIEESIKKGISLNLIKRSSPNLMWDHFPNFCEFSCVKEPFLINGFSEA